MRKLSCAAFLLTGVAVALATSQGKADNWFTEDLGDPWDFSSTVLGEDSSVDIGGWTQWGYHNKSTGLFNSHPGRFNNHQSWIYIEKAVDGSEGIDFGGRFDVMYGVDAADTQAFGNRPGNWDFDNGFDHGSYGWAFPQAYLEVAYGDFAIKGGHFYTLLGYEVVTAPDNFFYSHAFTMYNAEAFTHTGVLGTYTASDNVTIYAGWTAGWDTGFDQFNNGSSFLGGFSVGLGDDVTFTYITTAGNFGAIGSGYSHSLVLDVAVTDKLNYVAQSDLLHTNQGNFHDPDSGFVGTTTNTIGLNQYLLYSLTNKVGIGGRAEWFKADGVSYYGITGGVNIKPVANFIVRPEVRYQWSPSANGFSGIQNAANPVGLPVDEGAIFGVDAILTF
ncbi:MAG: porin [Planctomycetaceae bacterium]|nr:porin [Planctomycetaceae bacterium]